MLSTKPDSFSSRITKAITGFLIVGVVGAVGIAAYMATGNKAHAVFCEHHPMPCVSPDMQDESCNLEQYVDTLPAYDVAKYSRVYATEAQARGNSTDIKNILTTVGYGIRLFVPPESHADITKVLLPFWVETDWIENDVLVEDGFARLYDHTQPKRVIEAPHRLFQPAAGNAALVKACSTDTHTLVLVSGFLPLDIGSLTDGGALVPAEMSSRHPLVVADFVPYVERCGSVADSVPGTSYSVETYLRVYTAPEYSLANSTNPAHLIYTVKEGDVVYSDSYPVDNDVFPAALPMWIPASKFDEDKIALGTVAGITPRMYDQTQPSSVELEHKTVLTKTANQYNRIAGFSCEDVKGYKLVVLETYLYRPQYTGVLTER